ncbi:hypothetical protein NUH87_03670 [Pseudomonas batumici]|uniref:hypothetical protein n=1 Tax=Pseudomonas batumici TaxID=226910 RepID=UPI0030CE3F61
MARYLGVYASALLFCVSPVVHSASDCRGSVQKIILNPLKSATKSQTGYVLADNTFVIWAGGSVNLDGLRTAYHRDDQKGGGVDLLCNAGRAYPAEGASYEGAGKGNCPRFMKDYERIRHAGWKDPKVGAINWYGFRAEGDVTVQGHKVEDVVPVEQLDGSGFYVSTTSLMDTKNHRDPRDQARYLDAETIPFGVIPGNSPS